MPPRCPAADGATEPAAWEQREQPGAGGREQRFRSSWDAKEAGGNVGNPEADYLYELGHSSNINLNIDTGAPRDAHWGSGG